MNRVWSFVSRLLNGVVGTNLLVIVIANRLDQIGEAVRVLNYDERPVAEGDVAERNPDRVDAARTAGEEWEIVMQLR